MPIVFVGLLSGFTFAEEPPAEDVIELEEVTVESGPILAQVMVEDDGSVVDIVGEAQWRNLGASDLAAALRRVPGVTVSRYNPVGAFGGSDGGGVFIRGHGSARPGGEISTLIDGVARFNGVWTHPLLDMLSIDNASRIEIYKSPQPVRFGNMAFGAVNLIPKGMNKSGVTGQFLASAGLHETYTALGEGGIAEGPFEAYFVASHRESDGHRDNADGRVENLYAQVAFRPNENLRISVLHAFQEGQASDPRPEGAPPIPLVETYGTHSHFTLGRVDYRVMGFEGILRAWYEEGKTDWRQWDAGPPPPFGEAFTNRSEFDNYGLWLEERYRWENGLMLEGGWEWQNYGGSVQDVYDNVPGANVFNPEERLESHGLYLRGEWELELAGGSLTPSLGARWHFSREFEDEFGLQAGLVWESEGTRVFANFARAYNYAGVFAAVLNSRWARFPIAAEAWRQLDAETILHYEVGFSQQLVEWLKVTATIYYDEVEDAVRLTAPPAPVIDNLGSYEVLGSEVTLQANPAEGWEFFAGLAWQDAGPGAIPNAPRWSASAGVHWRFLEGWMASADLEYTGDQYTQGTRFSDPLEEVDSHFLVHARIAKEFALSAGWTAEVFLAVENLFDEDYEYRPGYPMPGISPTLGFEVGF